MTILSRSGETCSVAASSALGLIEEDPLKMRRKHRDPISTPGRGRSRSLIPGAALMRLEPRVMPAVVTPFAPRFSANANGEIVFVANTLMTAPSSDEDAENARAGIGSAINNNDFSMAYVDIDSDGTTFNSSRADLALPSGGTVLFAGLYWGAQSKSANRGRVLLQVPGSSTYASVVGTVVGSESSGDYSGFADVTTLVRSAGVGTYAVANVQATTGSNQEAGWTLVVAYGDPTAPPRNLTVFDGFAVIDSESPNVTIPISGFKAPLTGSVKASLGFVAYEGDKGYTGDSVKFNGTTLSDAQNPGDNFFNSTISNRGSLVATKSPNYANQMGLDADIISTSGLIANGATSAAINLTTGGETYYSAVVTTSIDLYAPIVSATKAVSDLNGGSVRPGDLLEYTDTVSVASGESATKFVLADAIPANTSFVSGSLIVNGSAATDAAGDDLAFYDSVAKQVVFRLGTGATSATGGTLAVGGTATVKFRVQVSGAAIDKTTITSQAIATFTGQSTLANLSASSPVASVTVESPADLAVAVVASNSAPNVGDLVTITVTVTNPDFAGVGGVAVNAKLPTGLTYVSSAPQQGTYDAATGAWAIGTLSAATESGPSSVKLTLVARVVATSAVVASASITAADRPDLTSSNNTGSATITPLQADLSLAKTVSTTTPNYGQRITFVTTLTNQGPNPSTNVTISDKLPTGFTLVSSAVTGGTYNPVTGVWSIVSIGGPPITLTIVADVATLATKVATASIVSADTYDPDSTDNAASVTVTPQKVDLAVVKTVDVARPNVGDVIVLTTRVTNAGPSTATAVVLATPAGAGLTILSSLPGQGSYDSSTGVWTVGSIASGSQAVLQVTARVVAADPLSSTAGVSHVDQYDTAANNDAGSVAITPRKADLALSQSVNKTTPIAGEVVTFTITLGNAGPDAASGVKVRDILPSGFQYQSATATRGTYDPTTSLWSVGSVASNTLQTLTILAKVVGAAASTNTAAIFAADQYDPNVANNSASSSSTPQQVDLSLATGFVQSRPNVGDVVQYTVAISTPGPGTATGVKVAVPLPPGLVFVGSLPGQGTYDAEAGTWTVGAVAPGTPITLVISAQLKGTGTTTATASITQSDQFDPGSDNNTATASITPQKADLALAASISDPAPNVGDQVTYTLVLTNKGSDAASGVTVAAKLPAGLSLVSVAGPGTYDPHTGDWTPGAVANGGQTTLVITATVAAPDPVTATASVSQADQYDPAAENNATSVVVTPLQAGLSLAATSDLLTTKLGDVVTFTITLSNAGPDTATGVRIRNRLPAGFRFVSATPTQGTYSNRTGVWSAGSLASEGSTTLTILAESTGGTPGALVSTIVAADPFDPDATDNTAQVTVTPLQADLGVTVDVSPARPNVGDQVVFSIHVKNTGPDDASNLRVAMTIPAGLVFVGRDGGSGSYDPDTGAWTIPSLELGIETTLLLTYQVVAADAGTYVATLTDSSEFDPTLDNRTGSATFTPQRSDLGLAASVDTPKPDKDQVVTFTFTVSDVGTDDATNVAVSVPLPAGYSLVGASATSGTYDGETGTWTVGTVAAGTSRVLTIQARVTAVAPGPVVATIAAADQFDPSGSNNTASAFVKPKKVDLSVGKVVSNPTPNVGNTIQYTISVVNGGPDTATGIILGDSLPTGITFVSATPGQGTYDSATGTWTVGTLAPGAEATLTLVTTVSNPSATINQATVQAVNQFDTNAANDGAQTSVVPQQSELRLTVLVDDPTPLVGDVVTFTISVKDLGINAATGVAIAVPLPAGLTYASDDGAGSYDSNTGTWTVGTVAADGTRTLTIHATVTSRVAATTIATVQAADQFDPNPNDNAASALTSPQVSDLVLAFTIGDIRPNVGDVIDLAVTVKNHGGDDATGVRIGVPLPSGLVYVSDTPDAGTFDPITGVWVLGPLAAGASRTLTLRVEVVSGDPIAVAANVAHLDQSDPVPDDNSISAGLIPKRSDLALVVAVDDANPDLNALVGFTLTVTNNGPDSATGVRILDALPAGLVYDSSTVGVGTYDALTGIWQVGTLAPGATATLTIRALVLLDGSSTVSASIALADQFDPDTTNDGGSATVTTREADLSAAIAVNVANPNVGDVVTLTITVSNTGPDVAHGVTLLNALPAGLTAIDATPGQGSFSLVSGVWSVGTIAGATSRTLQIRARVVAAGALADTVAIASVDESDPTTADNSASLTVTPQVADLALTLAVDQDRPNVGDRVTLTITLDAVGPDAATGVRVAGVLPAGLEYVSSTSGVGSFDPLTGEWTLGAVASGAAPTLTIVARVVRPDAISPSFSIVHADQIDPTTGDGVASATITPRQSDLALTTTVDQTRPNVGDRVTITVTLTATGDPATGVVVASPMPAGLTFVSSDAGEGYDPATGLWTVGAVDIGVPRVLHLVAVVASADAITAAAEVRSSDQFDPSSGNDAASATILPQQSDLTVTTVVDNPRPGPGELVTITITVTDLGDPASGVRVSSLLPSGLDFVSADAGGDYDPATGTWTVGVVAPETPRVLHLVARASASGPFVLTTSVAHVDQFDPTPADTTASLAISPRRADLALAITVDDPSPSADQVITFTLTLTNGGPDAATGVSIADHLPEGLAFVSATPGVGQFDAASGLWSIDDLAPGASATLQVRARVTRPGSATVTAEVGSLDQFGPNPTPSASATVVPRAVALSVRAEGLPASAVVGQRFDLRIIATNGGPDAATGVALPVVLPPGFRLVSVATGSGSFDPNSGLWTPGSIPPGGSQTLTLTVEVIAAGVQEVVAGPIRSDQFDASTADDKARADLVAEAGAGAAVVGTSSLGGTIFTDDNGDGRQDADEGGLAHATITLDGTDVDGNPVHLVAITTADGSYRFSGLRAGVYSLTMVSADATGIAGTLGGQVAAGQIRGIVLADGASGLGYGFAAHATQSVTTTGPVPSVALGRLVGFVYLDRNRNGVYNPGRDLGIATLRVILTGIDDAGRSVRLTTRTDAAGAYAFEGLRPGVYAITSVPNRYFRDPRVIASASGRPYAGIVVMGGSSAEYDFARRPIPGCRLIPLMGPTGVGKPVPRGPLLDRFFPIHAASARPQARRSDLVGNPSSPVRSTAILVPVR